MGVDVEVLALFIRPQSPGKSEGGRARVCWPRSEDPAVTPNPFQPREGFGREGAGGMAGTGTAMIQPAGETRAGTL